MKNFCFLRQKDPRLHVFYERTVSDDLGTQRTPKTWCGLGCRGLGDGRVQYAMVVMRAYSGWETSRREHCTTMGRSDSTRMA